MITIVRPTGEQRERLLANIGRDSWRYRGLMEAGKARHSLDGQETELLVWYYHFDNILDADVQQQHIRSRAATHNETLAQAEAFCRTHLLAMPQSDVILDAESKAFQGETMLCCMCGRTQRHEPDIESQWTWIEADETFGVYVCPNCLQDSEQARSGHYATVYGRVLRRIERLYARHLRGLNN